MPVIHWHLTFEPGLIFLRVKKVQIAKKRKCVCITDTSGNMKVNNNTCNVKKKIMNIVRNSLRYDLKLLV